MEIVFTGDFMRPAAAQWRPTQHYNIRWLHDLFAGVLLRLGARQVRYLAWDYQGVQQGGLGGGKVRELYGLLGIEPGIDGWAQLYGRALFPAAFRAEFTGLLGDAEVVVGFELPPYVKHLLAQDGRPYLDFNIHPVRFHEDIFFAVQSSSQEADRWLEANAMDEDELFLVAGVTRATARRLSNVKIEPGTELLLLQTQHDRTQIRDGRFVGILDVLSAAQDAGFLTNRVAVRPHPYEPTNRHVRGAFAALACRTAPQASIYELLAHESVARVLSLNSSAGLEARYFGRENVFLLPAPLRLSYRGSQRPAGLNGYVSLKDKYFELRFWAEILALLGREPAVLPPASTSLPPKPNRLRTSLKSFWGYNQVDTDIAVRLVKP